MRFFIDALNERRYIEDNKQFARLTEKTQVLVPQNGRHEVTKNRATHAYEVATSSLTIAACIASRLGFNPFDIDHQQALYNVSLLHDIGHPPFGHDGATLLDTMMREQGLDEGFSDNNNNLVVIAKNKMNVRDYVLASTIKYPTKLYSQQKEQYTPLLKQAIDEDKRHFSSIGIDLLAQNTTITCQIMDEADRNSYTFSDMTDFLCIGNKLYLDDMREVAADFAFNPDTQQLVSRFINVALSGKKSLIKATLSDFKGLANNNYTLTEQGVVVVDPQIEMFREYINRLTMRFYIAPIRKLPFHQFNLDKLRFVLRAMLQGQFAPSSHYADTIKNASNSTDRLRAIRDMIAETSDWYILRAFEDVMRDEIIS